MKKNTPVVLIVEDEPLIRMEAIDMIEDAGFATIEAHSADKAIALLQQHSGVDVLFTDIDMPGSMDGLALASYVRSHWPDIKIVVASGVVDAQRLTLPDGALFFPKPYPTSHIVAALQQDAARV